MKAPVGIKYKMALIVAEDALASIIEQLAKNNTLAATNEAQRALEIIERESAEAYAAEGQTYRSARQMNEEFDRFISSAVVPV